MFLHMVQLEKKEGRSRGDRLPIGTVKTEIISYILSRNDAVPFTDLKKHLKDKWGIRNSKNINNHLNDLKDVYIGKIKPDGKGFENTWDITKSHHLISIREDYKDILLMCDKSINIILHENEIEEEDIEYNEIKEMLRLSTSFFYMFLNSDSQWLKSNTYRYFNEIIIKKHHPELLDATENQQRFAFDTHWHYFLFELCYELDVYNGYIKKKLQNEDKEFLEKILNMKYKFYKPIDNIVPFIMEIK